MMIRTTQVAFLTTFIALSSSCDSHSQSAYQMKQDSNLPIVNLQCKTQPKIGYIEHYWFENENVGLVRTLFHRIVIPFEPFDSGLDYVEQPESTELVVDWVKLDLDNPSDLDGLDLSMDRIEGIEASIYLGAKHNWVDLKQFKITQTDAGYHIACVATIEFENERTARNETLEFDATAAYRDEASH